MSHWSCKIWSISVHHLLQIMFILPLMTGHLFWKATILGGLYRGVPLYQFFKYGTMNCRELRFHDDVIKWKHFPSYWPFLRGKHRSPVNSLHKGQWLGTLMFFVWSAHWLNGLVSNRETGDLRRNRSHLDVIVMLKRIDVVGCCNIWYRFAIHL